MQSTNSLKLFSRPLCRLLGQQEARRPFSNSRARSRELEDAYILSASRTPIGAFNGQFASISAPILGATAIASAVSKSGLPHPSTDDGATISHAYIGNVLSAGMGQSPARQAILAAPASFPHAVDVTTVNKVCSSGLKSVSLAAQAVQLGQASATVAGGMENMSRVPYYLPRGTQFPPFGEIKLRDGMISDGLWDPYNDVHMGKCAQNTADKFKISREAQDTYAIDSYKRTQEAWAAGQFAEEIAPVTVPPKKKGADPIVANEDEGYARLKLDKVPTLKPAFTKDGTVTAANSSSFNDGASAVTVASGSVAKQVLGASGASKNRVLARIVSSADAAVAPIDFPIAPAKAIPIALKRAGLSVKDIASWEINEAFAAVVVANAMELGLLGADGKVADNVNPQGGAIPLGHAIGSSGCRILVTMLHRLKPGEFGCIGICNGGGAASAMIVQRVDAI